MVELIILIIFKINQLRKALIKIIISLIKLNDNQKARTYRIKSKQIDIQKILPDNNLKINLKFKNQSWLIRIKFKNKSLTKDYSKKMI